MTIDEAIQDCIDQLPTEFVGVWSVSQYGDALRNDQIRRALWFDAAWEWLQDQDTASRGFMVGISKIGPGKYRAYHDLGNALDENPRYDLPTKYHALRAAVLLAKGIKP